jgi:hypothetical protein
LAGGGDPTGAGFVLAVPPLNSAAYTQLGPFDFPIALSHST